jgi:UDPglucose 6-dehydrogenase
MRICVIGTGYVGLVSGACLADLGHDVRCVDVNPERVDEVNQGKSPIFEEGLDAILARNVGTRLTATTDLAAAFADADVVLVCVGTPFDGEKIDLRYVIAAGRELGECLRIRSDYCLIVIKSTVVPGTTMGLFRDALEQASGKRAGPDFGLGMNPEFLAEGVAVNDFMEPDRIVLGGIDDRSVDSLAAMYQSFSDVPIIRTHPSTAEMIKYTSNSLLATLISFSNEIARICELIPDVDVADVMTGVHKMKHLTYRDTGGTPRSVSAASFLWAGCGFGGSCFPKDVKALVAQARELGSPARLLAAVIAVNEEQPSRFLGHLRAVYPSLKGLDVAVLGLAFKPGTDDIRESPALKLVPALVREGARVVCHDPVAMENFRQALKGNGADSEGVVFEADLARAVSDCAAVLLVTSWPEYADLPRLLEALETPPLLVDGRRFIAKERYARYAGIGLPAARDH